MSVFWKLAEIEASFPISSIGNIHVYIHFLSLLAEIWASLLGHFGLNCARYYQFCYFSFNEIPCCSILFNDRACNRFTGGACFPSS